MKVEAIIDAKFTVAAFHAWSKVFVGLGLTVPAKMLSDYEAAKRFLEAIGCQP